MSRQRGYTPQLERGLVSILYYEAKAQSVHMTTLANRLMRAALRYEGVIDATKASRVSETAPIARRSGKPER